MHGMPAGSLQCFKSLCQFTAKWVAVEKKQQQPICNCTSTLMVFGYATLRSTTHIGQSIANLQGCMQASDHVRAHLALGQDGERRFTYANGLQLTIYHQPSMEGLRMQLSILEKYVCLLSHAAHGLHHIQMHPASLVMPAWHSNQGCTQEPSS